MKRRRRFKGILLLAAFFMLLASIVSACSSNNGDPESTNSPTVEPAATNTVQPTEAPKEIVELKAFFPGDTPVGFEQVLEAVNNKLAADNIGAKLNIQFISWNDYGNLTLVKTSAGEDFDMFLDAPWLHIAQMISSDAIIPLDEYISAETTPNLLQTIPKPMWDANKFGGKIFGIPLGTTQGKVKGFIVRQDLREKHGIGEIKTLDDFEKFLYAIKTNEQDIIPFGIDSRNLGLLPQYFNPNYYTAEMAGKMSDIGLGVVGAVGTEDASSPKVIRFWETPGHLDTWKKMNKYYKDGIFEKNIAQQENAIQLFNQGKIAAMIYNGDGVEGMKVLDALKLPGVAVEYDVMIQDGVKAVSDFKQFNFLCVNKNSKNPQRVVDVMEWLSIKENHDLLEYGIEGTDWKAVGEDQIEQLSQYSFPGYVITWRPSLLRTSTAMLPGDKK